MEFSRVWCKECYTVMKNSFDKKYGKSWYFKNLCTGMNWKGLEKAEYIVYPPKLKVSVPKKLKNGSFSKSARKEIVISDFNFCPFCGKEITIDELTEE